MERGLVHSDRLFVAPIFTWYTNFISARDLLALPRADDPLLMNPSPARAIGLAPALLALPAVAAALFNISRNWARGGRVGRGAVIARDDRSFLILFFSLA